MINWLITMMVAGGTYYWNPEPSLWEVLPLMIVLVAVSSGVYAVMIRYQVSRLPRVSGRLKRLDRARMIARTYSRMTLRLWQIGALLLMLISVSGFIVIGEATEMSRLDVVGVSAVTVLLCSWVSLRYRYLLKLKKKMRIAAEDKDCLPDRGGDHFAG
jgi:hypothetical protein